jgi:hypothetical protein
MPAPFTPQEKAIVRFRLTKPIPAGPPRANPVAGGPPLPGVPAKSIGWEDTELFTLNPQTGDIAEVERQWKLANGPDSGREWQDALFPGPEQKPVTPLPAPEPPDVDLQGIRHRAAGQEELPGTVTEGVPVPGRGVGFAEGDERTEDAKTFGDEHLTLAQMDNMTDDELLQRKGIGPETLKDIHRARGARSRRAKK